MTDIDLAEPFPELRELRRAVLQQDWPAIAGQFEGLTDPDDHEYAARVVADVKGAEEFLGRAAQREPGPLARTLYSARLVAAGWEARTALRAQYVNRAQFAAFHDHLRRAERVLIEVTAEDPANSTAWAQRIKTNRGLELGQNEARRRYDRLSRHVPHVYNAQAGMVQQFCPKWGGSVEKVHAFGLECLRSGPEGSLAALAIVEAHFEIAFHLEEGARTVYWRRTDVREEIEEAANRSVRHPAFRSGGYRAVTAHSHFALAYTLLGDRAAARPHFDAAGDHGAGVFWGYFFFDERSGYRSARAKAAKA
ncbi:hypothetical protein ABT297_16960 [Dactylosporangium sp. NPDC000555]|uniref:hypothetical protein n=1 Tax=Dactylosporangium sp. NPDC000555 TaxID=3154260 RepID=UPI003322B597